MPGGYIGLYLYSSNNSIINNSVGTALSNSYGVGIFGYNNIVSNSNASTGTASAIWVISPSSNNLVYNNTLIGTGASKLLAIDAASSGNNTFYWNNFTNTSGLYVQDLNGSNYYNKTEGNIWTNVVNGSVVITGRFNSQLPGLYIGSDGTGWPYNNSTSQSKFSCNFAGCADAAPLTTIQAPSATILVFNGTAYVAFTAPSQLRFHCSNPPTICQPSMQTVGQPIFRIQNIDVSLSSTQQWLKLDTNWTTATMQCSNSSTPGGIVLRNGTYLQSCTNTTVLPGQTTDAYLYLNVSSLPAGFMRTFNISARLT